MQPYPSLLIAGCVVSNRAIKLSGFILSDDAGNVLSSLHVVMPLLTHPHQLEEEGAFQGYCHLIHPGIILNIGPAISYQTTC